jgi:hypothetical protein
MTDKPMEHKKHWFKCELCGKRVYTIHTILFPKERVCGKCKYGDK